TGDFKLDDDPPMGAPTDLKRFRQLGQEGVLLLLSDSTNAERAGHSGSERHLVSSFERIFREAPGRIVAATFASNIQRIQRFLDLAVEFGRRVAVAVRSLRENVKTAQALGHLKVKPALLAKLEQAEQVPPANLLLLAARTQGE